MTEKEKLSLIEETIECGSGTLTPETELDSLEEYDSITVLGIMAMLEDEFGKRVGSDVMKGLKTVNDILLLME